MTLSSGNVKLFNYLWTSPFLLYRINLQGQGHTFDLTKSEADVLLVKAIANKGQLI
jgi:hypothetical protein